MLTKNTPSTLDTVNPWSRDILGRKDVGDYLTPVIASIHQPYVVSIHSAYGTGKTFFIECWQQDLENKGFKTAYFNAWETDFSQDALSAFISSLRKRFAKDEGIKAKLSDLAKKTGGFLRSKALPLITKSLIQKSLGDEALEAVSDLINLDENGISDFLCSTATEALKAQEAADESMQEFRKYLGDLIENITNQDSSSEKINKLWANKEDQKKLIIFIDELDRCRPDYAVGVLECIKHFFSVEGIVFVLSIDDEQLKNAIASVYGPNLDGEGYLRRFIDWQFILPVPSAAKYADFLAEKFSLKDLKIFSKDSSDYSISGLVDTFGLLSEIFKLSLRQQEQCFSNINLVCRSTRDDEAPFVMALGACAVIEMKWPGRIMDVQGDLAKIEELCDDVFADVNEIHLLKISRGIDWFREMFFAWFVNKELYNKLEAEENNKRDQSNALTKDDSSDALDKRQELEKRIGFIERTLKLWSGFKWHYNIGVNTTISGIIIQRITGANRYNKS